MTGKKKMWQRPEMTVVVRSNPEEAVLSTCKTSGIAGPIHPEDGGFDTCIHSEQAAQCPDGKCCSFNNPT